ncbi:MAG: hypothetical protein WA952_16525 [Lewinella sp.]
MHRKVDGSIALFEQILRNAGGFIPGNQDDLPGWQFKVEQRLATVGKFQRKNIGIPLTCRT